MIQVLNATHYYGSFCAVRGISFKVEKGEIVALLGPNGAGKSTILKILSSQLIPTQGTAKINGVDIVKEPVKAKKMMGYLPEVPPLYDVLEVEEFLRFVGRAKLLEDHELKERMEWVKELTGLHKVWRRPIGELSRGYRQRVGIAQAIINDPPIVILDEPTTGLDPLQTLEIRDVIKSLAKRNKAVLFSTHILQEPMAIADRVIIINEGRLIAEGSIEELSDRCGLDTPDMEKIFINLVKSQEKVA